MLRLESKRNRASANDCMFINQCHSAGYYLIIHSVRNSVRFRIENNYPHIFILLTHFLVYGTAIALKAPNAINPRLGAIDESV